MIHIKHIDIGTTDFEIGFMVPIKLTLKKF